MELATGEFFLRESVKKRKKMEEIKVSTAAGPADMNELTVMKSSCRQARRQLFFFSSFCCLVTVMLKSS